MTSDEPKLREGYGNRAFEMSQSIPDTNCISNIGKNKEPYPNEG
jgi:hypothetical protein